MKTVLLIAGVLFAGVAPSLAQEQCSKGYQMCMEGCGGGASSKQAQCVMSCQETNNSCSEAVYGQAVRSQPSIAQGAGDDQAADVAQAQDKFTGKKTKKKSKP